MIGYIDEERVQRLSLGDKDVPLYQKILKVSEESGELSQAFLKFDKSKNTSASAASGPEAVLEEVLDIMNCAMDIVNYMTKDNEYLEEYVRNTFQAKLDKWESKQIKYTEPSDINAKPESFEGSTIINDVVKAISKFFNKVNSYFNI